MKYHIPAGIGYPLKDMTNRNFRKMDTWHNIQYHFV
ncbi:uncharacterized protein METZ01_LOCUS172252 [marine metagenome]|uniref:Uncharacterized protein n=1 Tax=marine metagenome TaxID=408172 RepID=A0A382C035_9ZZZZ